MKEKVEKALDKVRPFLVADGGDVKLGTALAMWFAPLATLLFFVVTSLADSGPGTLRQAVGTKHAAVFLLVYWLSPWRLYHSGFVWEPSGVPSSK